MPVSCGTTVCRLFTAFACVAAVASIACDEPLSQLAGPTPDLQPTFASVQAQIFEASDSSGRRACTDCHTAVGRSPAMGMNLTHDFAYDQIVNVASRERPAAVRVVPGDPDNSYLIHKIEGNPDIVGLRMPYSGAPFLTDGQILILRRWIAIGAPRN